MSNETKKEMIRKEAAETPAEEARESKAYEAKEKRMGIEKAVRGRKL